MSRDRMLWMGALSLLLLFGAWWFTAASAATGHIQLQAAVGVPVGLMIVSAVLFWIGMRKGISGLLVLAATITGIGVMSLLRWLVPIGFAQPAWLLLPAFTGAGILVENRLGFGWRFTNRQGLSMLLASLGLFLAVTILSILSSVHFSGGGWLSNNIRLHTESIPSVFLGQPNLPFLFSIFSWR